MCVDIQYVPPNPTEAELPSKPIRLLIEFTENETHQVRYCLASGKLRLERLDSDGNLNGEQRVQIDLEHSLSPDTIPVLFERVDNQNNQDRQENQNVVAWEVSSDHLPLMGVTREPTKFGEFDNHSRTTQINAYFEVLGGAVKVNNFDPSISLDEQKVIQCAFVHFLVNENRIIFNNYQNVNYYRFFNQPLNLENSREA